MSLADRLAKASQRDRIAEVRLRVQERLVEVLGPRLYDATLSDNELEGLVQNCSLHHALGNRHLENLRGALRGLLHHIRTSR